MNIIKRIKIENIKGKDNWELTFDDFNANQPNIIVAPNGYGKSTLAVAFEAASRGCIKLKPKDYYMQDVSNHPMLEIELSPDKSKLFVNIGKMLLSYHNIDLLLSNIESIKKCCTQRTIQKKMSTFLSDCSDKGTAKFIKSSISDEKTDELYGVIHLKELLKVIDDMEGKDYDWRKIDTILTAIQICKLMTELGDWKELKKVHQYLYYKQVKSILDERLKMFNTTGRSITTHEKNKKLLVSFERADSMSNGERDVLSFIANLTKFEVVFSKPMGILVIDEVFDYLDGSKLLAVQYYLSKLINSFSQLYLPTLIQMCFQTIILRKRISITFLVIHE